MANISQLSGITTAVTTLSNLVLVTPQNVVGYQPLNPAVQNSTPLQQSKALVFHYEGENVVTIESDITDHFAENNSALQDQIALKPEMITVSGFIGELNDVVPTKLQPLQIVANKLVVISGYTPSLSASALLAYNEALFLYQTAANAANSALTSLSTLNGSSSGEAIINGSSISNVNLQSQSKQQIAFQQFYGYWLSRTLFNVQTPWAIFQNCAIKSLRAIQDAETNTISNFEVTFKIMRFAQTAVVSIAQGQLGAQSAPLTNNGAQSLTSPAPLSLSSGIAGVQ